MLLKNLFGGPDIPADACTVGDLKRCLDFIYRGDLSDVPLHLRPALLVNMVNYRAGRLPKG